MPRKRRRQVHGETKKPTRYDDKTPRWMQDLAEEAEELADIVPERKRWQAPGRIFLQFSEKDKEKERQRREAIQRQRSRTTTRR